MTRVWLITGASSGLGYAFAKKALQSGDNVAGLARHIETLEELRQDYPTQLFPMVADVTQKEAITQAIQKVHQHFGHIDIVVNSAGSMMLGMAEEFTEQQVRDQMETNFFGAVWVTQAVMPIMRSQQSGHIIQISSIGGIVTGPMTSMYSASKFALEGFSEALAHEAAHFGIHTTIVEPGGYWTNLYLKLQFAEQLPSYDSYREELSQQENQSVDSAPELAASALWEIVQAKNPPLRFILGSMVFDAALDHTTKKINTWREWEPASRHAEKATPPPEGYGE